MITLISLIIGIEIGYILFYKLKDRKQEKESLEYFVNYMDSIKTGVNLHDLKGYCYWGELPPNSTEKKLLNKITPNPPPYERPN